MLYAHPGNNLDDPAVMYFDDESIFLEKHVGWLLGAWVWRLPDPITDAFTQPDYAGRYRAARILMPDGEPWGWMVDPDTEPPTDVLEAWERRCREAARDAFRGVGELD